ncbi:hypothetical protein Tco_0322435 [Tanacetum coccineum]
MECRVRRLRRNTFISYAVTGLIPINRGLIQAIPTSLPSHPIREATKASNLQIIPPGVQGTMAGVDVDTLTMEQYLALSRENQAPGVVQVKKRATRMAFQPPGWPSSRPAGLQRASNRPAGLGLMFSGFCF